MQGEAGLTQNFGERNWCWKPNSGGGLDGGTRFTLGWRQPQAATGDCMGAAGGGRVRGKIEGLKGD